MKILNCHYHFKDFQLMAELRKMQIKLRKTTENLPRLIKS